jgi:hypothetical protein
MPGYTTTTNSLHNSSSTFSNRRMCNVFIYHRRFSSYIIYLFFYFFFFFFIYMERVYAIRILFFFYSHCYYYHHHYHHRSRYSFYTLRYGYTPFLLRCPINTCADSRIIFTSRTGYCYPYIYIRYLFFFFDRVLHIENHVRHENWSPAKISILLDYRLLFFFSFLSNTDRIFESPLHVPSVSRQRFFSLNRIHKYITSEHTE